MQFDLREIAVKVAWLAALGLLIIVGSEVIQNVQAKAKR